MSLPEDWQVRVIQLLAVPGLLIAYFLYLYHESYLIGVCEPNQLFDCGQVSGPNSPWASIGPVPIALIGLLGYVVIFLTTWLQDWIDFVDDYLPELLLALIGIAFLFTLGLTLLEALVIHAFCQYCVYSAVIVLVMFVLALSYLRARKRA